MSAAEINDGGSAFPGLNAEFVGISSDGEERYETQPSGGMTLRDYFAAHEVIDPAVGMSATLAERLAGRPQPKPVGNKAAHVLDLALFWADAEAAYRYLRADAMLRARAAS